jgi:hypothetical protein
VNQVRFAFQPCQLPFDYDENDENEAQTKNGTAANNDVLSVVRIIYIISSC